MIDIANERMNILFFMAKKEFSNNPNRSHRYVSLARKISKKYNTKIPENWRRSYCKNCYKFLNPSFIISNVFYDTIALLFKFYCLRPCDERIRIKKCY